MWQKFKFQTIDAFLEFIRLNPCGKNWRLRIVGDIIFFETIINYEE